MAMQDRNLYQDYWVLIETEDGKAKSVGLELLSAGREIADQRGCRLVGVILGFDLEEAAREAIGCGADRVILLDTPELISYSTDVYAGAVDALVRKYRPEAILLGATPNGRDLGPKIACGLGTGLTADCTGIGFDEETGNILWTRPTFGGNLMATILCPDTRPQMGTVRPGVFRKRPFDGSGKGEIIRERISSALLSSRTRVIRQVIREMQEQSVADAPIVVSGGRGMGSAENFRLLKELAELLGGVVGCSRAVVENGWMPQSAQVGQSGKTIAPKLYIAAGISGAIQHLVGIGGAEMIVAINKDPDAPIFQAADYGIVGDVQEILPALIEAVRAGKTAE